MISTTVRKLLIACCLLLPSVTFAQKDFYEVKLKEYEEHFNHFKYKNDDSMVFYLKQGLDYFTKEKYDYGRARMLTMLGNTRIVQGNPEKSKEYLNEALAIYERLKDVHGIAAVNNSLGTLNGKMGNYKEAMQRILKALSIFEAEKDTAGIVSSYTKLGAVYEVTDRLDQSLKYYDKALALSAAKKDLQDDIAYLYNNKGIVYCKLDSLEKAIPFFEKAIQFSRSEDLAYIRILPLTNLGKLYAMMDQDDRALASYNEALAITPVHLLEERTRLAINIASIYAKHDPQKAIAVLNDNLDSAKKIGSKLLQIDILHKMVGIQKNNGHYKEAFLALEQEDQMEDSVFKVEKMKAIANLQAMHDLEKSHKEFQILNREKQWHQRMQIAATVVAIILACALIVVFRYYSTSKNLLRKVSAREAELAKANQDKNRLFSIIGHDLKGPISNIPVMLDFLRQPSLSEADKSYILTSVTESAQASSEVLDKLLNWGKNQIKGGQQKSVFNPAKIARTNIQLQQASIEAKHLVVRNNIADSLSVIADVDNIAFIIRNLLANAIKFSFEHGVIELTSTVSKEKGYATITVRDQGTGMTDAQAATVFEMSSISKDGTAKEKGNSIGLILCKEFAEQNGGRIWVETEPGKGSAFHFTVPLAVGSLSIQVA